jgi:integrase
MAATRDKNVNELLGHAWHKSVTHGEWPARRRLADESAESGWLSPELAVQGLNHLGKRSGNWLTRSEAQELVNAASKSDMRGWRDGAILGLFLGCGPRRSEVVGLKLDQLQTREGHWVTVDLVGEGGRLRTVPMPLWCKELVDTWIAHLGVSKGRVFRRLLRGVTRQDGGVTANIVGYAVKRCAVGAGV